MKAALTEFDGLIWPRGARHPSRGANSGRRSHPAPSLGTQPGATVCRHRPGRDVVVVTGSRWWTRLVPVSLRWRLARGATRQRCIALRPQ